ncbi:hypothetical protein ACFL3C_00600 [Patescibacteria group bacterium]
MANPEGSYYDEDELGTPEAHNQSDYEAPESAFMPQINEAQEETHASYARLWEQYSSEQGISTDEEPEAANDEGMSFAEETPENIGGSEGGGMAAAA